VIRPELAALLIERVGTGPAVSRRIDLQTAADSHIDHVKNIRGRKASRC
jgi:hypothetical protein